MSKKSLSDKLNRLNADPIPVAEPVTTSRESKHPMEKKSKKQAVREIRIPEKEVTSEIKEPLTEEEQDDLLIEKTLKEARTLERRESAFRVVQTVLMLACVYVAFLIYGAAVTTYEYEDSGKVEAQRMNVSDIRARKEYEKIYYYYEACRGLYECTLLLDYRLGAGVEEPLMIAPEYEGLLDTVENLSIKTDALTVETGYSQIRNMMLSWIQSDIAVYLQNMSVAISQNDSTAANNALQDRDRVYNDFLLITQNMAAFGENIKGVDINSIRHWTPENYIDEEINGETS